MSITEQLANLPIPWVLGIVAALLVLRFVLLKQKAPMAKSIAEIAESLAVALALVFLLIRPFIVQAFYIPSESMVPTLLKQDHILVNKFIYRFGDPKAGDVVVFKAPEKASPDQPRDFIKRVVGLPGDTVRITPGYVLVGSEPYDHEQLRSLLGLDPQNGKVRLLDGRVLADGRVVSAGELATAANRPNAKVKIVPGKVYVNGRAVKEPFIAEDPDKPYPVSTTPDQGDIVRAKDGQDVVKIPKGKLLVMGDNRNDSNDARFWGLLDRSRMLGKAMFIFWPLGRISWVH